MYTDTQLALAHAHDLRTQAGRDRLARLAACCKPGALRVAVGHTARAALHWLRHGQLQAPRRCCDWPT